MPHGGDSDSGAVQLLAVGVACVLVLYFDNLTAGVRAAVLAREVRTLRRVTLRTLNGRHGVELPVRRATAARLTARGFPL
jgi:hypothetical protein